MFKENYDSKKEIECISKTSEAPRHLNSAKMLITLALVALVFKVIVSVLDTFLEWYSMVGSTGRLNLNVFLVYLIINISLTTPWIFLLISIFHFRKEFKPTLFFPLALLIMGCTFLISSHSSYLSYNRLLKTYIINNLATIELIPVLLNTIIYFIVAINFIFVTVLTFFKGSLKKIFIIIVSSEFALFALYRFIYPLVTESREFLFAHGFLFIEIFSCVADLAFAAVLIFFALKNEIPVSCFSFGKKDKTLNEK